MGVHKIIESGGEQYLPFALSKLRQLVGEAATQWGTASKVIYADGGAVIRLRVAGDEQFLHITAGGTGYQFTSTGPAVSMGRIAGISTGVQRGYGVQVRLKKGKVEAVPLGSTAEADTEDPPRWPYSGDTNEMTAMLTKKNIWQVSHISEYAYYPRAGEQEKVREVPLPRQLLGAQHRRPRAIQGVVYPEP